MGSLGWVGKGWGEMLDIFLVMCFFFGEENIQQKSNKTVFDIKDITDVNQVSHAFFVEFFLGRFVHSQSINEKIQLKMRDAEKAGSIFWGPKMLEINKWEDFVHQTRLPSREPTYDKLSKEVADFSRIRGPKIIGWMLIFNLL